MPTPSEWLSPRSTERPTRPATPITSSPSVGVEAVHVRLRAPALWARLRVRHVGVEPTGEAFNSIVLDEVAKRPFNPMVNAGAIAVAALMPGVTAQERICTMLNLFSDL